MCVAVCLVAVAPLALALSLLVALVVAALSWLIVPLFFLGRSLFLNSFLTPHFFLRVLDLDRKEGWSVCSTKRRCTFAPFCPCFRLKCVQIFSFRVHLRPADHQLAPVAWVGPCHLADLHFLPAVQTKGR